MLGAIQTPLYLAQTSIEIQTSNRTYASNTVDADVGNSLDSFVETQIRIIQSRSLLERTLSKLGDSERARILDTPHFWWKRSSYDQSLESIRHNISARPSDQAGIIDISFLSPDATASAHFLNLLTQSLEEFNIERAWRTVQHNREWVERQTDDLREKWEQSERILAEYSPAAPSVVKAESKPSKSSKKIAAQPDARAERNLEVSDVTLHQLQSKLEGLNGQMMEWQALYGPAGSTVQKLKSEVAQTQTEIEHRREALRLTVTLNTNSPMALTSLASQSRPDQAQAAAHLRALQEEADSNRMLYETTASRLKEASIAAASLLGDISVVDPAIPVGTPTTPSQFLVGSLGGLTGLFIGIAFIGLRDHLSSTFCQPAFLGHFLDLQVLGAIPADRLSSPLKTYDKIVQEPALHLNFEKNLQTAEAFRSIRSSILLGANQHPGVKRLVFTSAESSEGKTFVVCNLGAALASAQRRVLLIDGNLRNPGLHKIFGADNKVGLADLLSRQLTDHPVTSREVIRETQIPDLYLLCAGRAGPRAPEILSSMHLPQLIREFAKGFDLVLLDSSPILPYADARSLARSADSVVLIVKAGTTPRNSARLARDLITQDGSPITGVILNQWDANKSMSA